MARVALITGECILETREALNLTQTQFADILGVHTVSISRWERGKLSPTPYQSALIVRFRAAADWSHEAQNVGKMLATDGAIAGLYFLLKTASEPQCQKK